MSDRVARLRLTRERLAELTNDELSAVAAGQNLTGNYTPWCPTLPAKDCDFTPRCFTGTETQSCNCYSWVC